ncbi:MAG: dienelactone hydrolase family protein [Bacteroidota bacterium]
MKLAILMLILVSSVTHAEIIGKVVEYTANNVALKGYIVYDNALKEKRPAVIVVHEWWGVTDYPKKRAEMLASLGYVAFAVDMYGSGKVADNPGDAQKFAGESMKDLSLLKAKFVAAIELLKKNEHVDSTRIAAIGYCYGGGVVLNMARAGVDLKGVVSFHGSLATTTPAEKWNVKAKILVCNGGADKFISENDIKNFKQEMKAAGADFKFLSYKGALHAFTNPAATELGKKFNMPIAYNESGDKRSWKEMRRFLKAIFNN